ncbi:MAG: M15 family metallopeptidase [Proteobacteria bacterium]|nr:M15 family metallopeptidase [Pseudomonadota bacterium]
MKTLNYLFGLLSVFYFNLAYAMPSEFVYLKDIDPSILQDIRYAGYHNAMGKPSRGYNAPECILTRDTASALSKIQAKLKQSNYTLKVYDCYRPEMAVQEFMTWSLNLNDQKMKAEFYPKVDKENLFADGYFAEKSGHSRGSTVDITIVKLPAATEPKYQPGDKLVSCFAPYRKRYRDNGIDMGVGFDCFDPRSNYHHKMSIGVHKNRLLLRTIMQEAGFVPYNKEIWHFTLRDEPFPEKYFNFPIQPKSKI